MSLLLASWNVNGIRAILKKGNFIDFLQTYQPDIVCLQETKASPEQVSLQLDGYHQYWNSAIKKGYSGTAIFTKIPAESVNLGMGLYDHDQEGRLVTLEFPNAFLVNVYTPNAQEALKRLAYRTREWDICFLEYVKGLEKRKPVIFCGDLNVAHKEIDLANPARNVQNAGFTPEERQSFDRIIAAGFIDTFRHFDQSPGKYSWWSMRTNARVKNIGWRIDYFCVSQSLAPALKGAAILPSITGSDHCPVTLTISKQALLL